MSSQNDDDNILNGDAKLILLRISQMDSRLSKVETKVDALHDKMLSQPPMCPAPGSCLILANDMKAVTAANAATLQRVLVLEDRVMCLEKWQWKTAGAFSLLLVVLTLFAPAIRKLLNLE
jgi:hypothetical protein